MQVAQLTGTFMPSSSHSVWRLPAATWLAHRFLPPWPRANHASPRNQATFPGWLEIPRKATRRIPAGRSFPKFPDAIQSFDLAIGVTPIDHTIHDDLIARQFKKHTKVANAQTIFRRETGQMLYVAFQVVSHSLDS